MCGVVWEKNWYRPVCSHNSFSLSLSVSLYVRLFVSACLSIWAYNRHVCGHCRLSHVHEVWCKQTLQHCCYYYLLKSKNFSDENDEKNDDDAVTSKTYEWLNKNVWWTPRCARSVSSLRSAAVASDQSKNDGQDRCAEQVCCWNCSTAVSCLTCRWSQTVPGWATATRITWSLIVEQCVGFQLLILGCCR